MTNPHDFDEALISGYLDDELTQGEAQRVRVHLEGCAECSATADEVRKIKEATLTTEFRIPEDTQWDEAPRTGMSGVFRSLGWLIGGVWLAVTAGFVVWQVATESENLLEAVIVFGFWLAAGLVLLSVLIDRLQTRKTDRYRRIQK